MLVGLHSEGVLIPQPGVLIWIALAAVPLAAIGWIVGIIVIWGMMLGHIAARLQGWPFAVGERVWILTGRHKNTIAKVYEVWTERGQVRVELGPELKEKVEDVYCAVEICRARNTEPDGPANAGRAPRFQSGAIGPGWLASSLAFSRAMPTNKSLTSPTRKRMVVVSCIFAVLVCGILFLSWKDIYSEVPEFEQLQEARANEFRVDVAREVYSPLQYSLEFYDKSGKRYQVGGAEKTERDQIATALSTDEPVLLRYGRWRSPFPSTKIFTVYQVEVGTRVIIPYERLASGRHREQSAGPMIMLCTVLAAGLAIFIGVRSQMKFQRQLEPAKSKNSNEVKS